MKHKNFQADFICLDSSWRSRKSLGSKIKIAAGVFSALAVVAGLQTSSFNIDRASADTSFNVNVVESLSVSITTPTDWASGSINTFLRNTVNLNVTSNNANGFTASMYSDTTTDLTNSTSGKSETMPTLAASSTRGNFPANYWGYSLNDTSSGSDASNYNAMTSSTTSPITIFSSNTANTLSKDVYFGAKANAAQASGTYTGTVIFNVVSNTINPDTNPITPVSPATPNDTTPGTATYDVINNRTVYYNTYTNPPSGTSGGTTTTTAEISAGDTTQSYADPAGVTEHTSFNMPRNLSIVDGLAIAATLAATSGFFFFILAKRREDDEDDEEQTQLS